MEAAAWSSFIFPTNAADQPTVLQPDFLPPLSPSPVDPSPAPAPPPPAPAAPLEGEGPKPLPRGPPHVCPLCSKCFRNNYNLRRHQRTHGARPKGREVGSAPGPAAGAGGGGGGARPVRKDHACELCGKGFRDVYHLNRHRLSHSDEKPFECPVCQQRFKRKDRMGYHVRSHQGGVHKPYSCSHCGKAFSRPDHLNSHIRQVHSTERPFKCQTCGAAFATKDRLRAHMVRHEEKVPCHVCGKLLSAAYITDHMKVHNDSPTHTCDICNKGFTTAAYLRVHARKHHGVATLHPYKLVCERCGVLCHTQVQLNGHKGTHDRHTGGDGDHGDRDNGDDTENNNGDNGGGPRTHGAGAGAGGGGVGGGGRAPL